jgi:two-component system NtrC family sensor kinase
MCWKNKILLSLGVLGILFFLIVYLSGHHYLLPNLLNIESGGDQAISINRYAFNQVIHNYLIVIICIGLFLSGIVGFLLHIFLKKNETAVKNLHYAMANEVKKVEELYEKLSILEKNAKKIEDILHPACDLLNNIGTSLSLAKEKIENSNAEKLTNLVTLLSQHQNDLGTFIMTSIQGQQVPSYLAMIAKAWVEENNYLAKELALLNECFNKIDYLMKMVRL